MLAEVQPGPAECEWGSTSDLFIETAVFRVFQENSGLVAPWIIGFITFMALEAVAMVYSNVLRDHVNRVRAMSPSASFRLVTAPLLWSHSTTSFVSSTIQVPD